jgi:hypothetical protein
MKVYEAIAAVTAEMAKDGISKDRKNQQQGYQFRGIDDVYNALSPMLARHHLCILPRILSRELVERQTLKGGVLFYVTVEAEFDFVSAEDGSKHTVKTYGEAMDSADKATNKAMSAAYKYAAMQSFCIPTEGDNDADAHTHDVAPRQAAPKQAPAAKNEKARETFAALQSDMRQCKTKDDLGRWWRDEECKALRATLPADWQANLKTQLVELGEDMAKKRGTVEAIQDQFPGSTVTDERITDVSGRELELMEG